jgi:hypothetical protein
MWPAVLGGRQIADRLAQLEQLARAAECLGLYGSLSVTGTRAPVGIYQMSTGALVSHVPTCC